jgi:hypothetical protein
MAGGQLLNGREPSGPEPNRVDGPPALLQGAAEHGSGTVAAQVAVPLPVPASHTGVQLQARTADQRQPLVAVVWLQLRQLCWPAAGQRPSHPGRLGVRLQIRPGVGVEWAQLADPVGQRSNSASCGRRRSLWRPRGVG